MEPSNADDDDTSVHVPLRKSVPYEICIYALQYIPQNPEVHALSMATVLFYFMMS